MPNFIKEKEGVQFPSLFFSNTQKPVLNMEGEYRLKSVPYTGNPDPNFEEDCIIINKEDGISGLYTGAMSYCHALTMIQRDANGEITKIAMQHFAGGLNKNNLEKFIEHCQKKDFNDNLELVHYPGKDADSSKPNRHLDAQFEKDLENGNFKNQNTIQRIYHADPCTDCCVMFNGQIGNADFVPFKLGFKPVELQLDSLEVAKINFQGLIDKDPEKSAQLAQLRETILSDELLSNPAMFLEKTRQFIVEAKATPEKKQGLYQEYTKEVNKQPYLSTGTKIACVVLAATIIGIIPAVIIATRYKSEVKELRENQLNMISEHLNLSGPSSRVK